MASSKLRPSCGHSICSQYFIDTGDTRCVEGERVFSLLVDGGPRRCLLPAGGAYPQDALWMRAVHDGYVTAFPLGGGFEHRIPQAALRDGRFRVVTQADLDTVSLIPASFTLDGENLYRGWHNNHRWNGFAMPWFTQDVFIAICRDIGLGVRIIDDTAVELAASTDAKEEPSLVAFVPAPDAGGLLLGTFDGWCWMLSKDE